MDTNALGLNPATVPSVTLVLSMEQLQVISEALVELPVRVAMPVINTINQQLTQQYLAQEEAEKARLAAAEGMGEDEA